MASKPPLGFWQSLTPIKTWVLAIFAIVGTFNVIIFLALMVAYLRPDTVPVPITGDVALGMHLQLLEAFLAALAIGLAVLGFVGFNAVREAAERRAEETAREVMQQTTQVSRSSRAAPTAVEPDLTGLDEEIRPGDRLPEEEQI